MELLRDGPERRLAASDTLCLKNQQPSCSSEAILGGRLRRVSVCGQLQIEYLSWEDERGHSNRTEIPKLDRTPN